MIVGWIWTTIEPRVRSTVTFITYAHKLWENLKTRFSVGNKVRVHQLMAKLAMCHQDGQAVIDYYGRLAKIWEEIQIYKPPLSCTCAAASAYEKEKEEEHVHQFFMGLVESRFGHIGTAIIEADELPSLGKVYAKVIREEDRLNSAKNREQQQQDAVGFVTRREPLAEPASYTPRRDFRDVASNPLRFDSLYVSDGNRATTRICSHCGRSGHDNNFCWKIIGYPVWMQDRNRNNGRVSGRGGRFSGSSGRG